MAWRTASLIRAVCVSLAFAAGCGVSAQAGQSPVSTGTEARTSARFATLPAANPQGLDQQFTSLFREGRYLAAINLVEEADPATIVEPLKSIYRQLRPALDGFVVPADPATQPPPTTNLDRELYGNADAEDAIAVIVERARRTSVVIINETHDNPRDRAFVLAVAEALRPIGYTVYAAEGFTNFRRPAGKPLPQQERLVADGYARYDTGFLMVDPMFGHLVRRALSLGYRPMPYEYAPPVEDVAAYLSAPMNEQVAMREHGQAENLASAIAAAGPNEKFLVHVGYSHAAERPLGPEGNQQEWMAAKLARLTGINPLTIDQTNLSEYQPSSKLWEIYARLTERVGNRSKVFLKDNHPIASGSLGEATDLQVVHPPIRTVGGRPDWLQGTGRRAVPIPAELLPKEGRRLIQVFGAGEATDAVPIDQVLVVAGEEPPLLYVLPRGEIRWAVQDE